MTTLKQRLEQATAYRQDPNRPYAVVMAMREENARLQPILAALMSCVEELQYCKGTLEQLIPMHTENGAWEAAREAIENLEKVIG